MQSASAKLVDVRSPQEFSGEVIAMVGYEQDAVRARLSTPPTSSYLRDFIYGAIDDAVTTFAVVAGVQGAGLSASVVLILGGVNLIADG